MFILPQIIWGKSSVNQIEKFKIEKGHLTSHENWLGLLPVVVEKNRSDCIIMFMTKGSMGWLLFGF